MADKKQKQLDALTRYIKRVLKEQNMYRNEMSYQVELLASDLLAYRKIREKVLDDNTEILVKEKSREGDDRFRENPSFNLLAKFADRVRKDLRSLKMNMELLPAEIKDEEDDALAQLLKENRDDE